MNERMIFIFIILVPLLIYLRAGFRRQTTNDYSYFLNPANLISSEKFANTATAYSFQVSSLSFFFFLGYAAPAAAIVNAITWGIGILLFLKYSEKIPDFFGSQLSLMAYVQQKFQAKYFRLIAALLVYVAFLGLLLAELLIGTRVFGVFNLGTLEFYMIVIFFAVFILLYYQNGGHLSVINTDQQQLLVSFFGFYCLLVWSLSTALHGGESQHLWVVPTILLLSLGLLIVIFAWIHTPWHASFSKSNPYGVAIFSLQCVAFIAISMVVIVSQSSGHDIESNSNISVQTWSPWNIGFTEFGIVSFISAFIITPLLWHFGDATHWHRLGALRVKTESKAYDNKNIKNGLRIYSLQSPLTIVITASLGALAHVAFPEMQEADAYTIVSYIPETLLASTHAIGKVIIGGLFATGVVAIMLSTIDGFLATNVFVAIYDILPKTRDRIDQEKSKNLTELTMDADASDRIIKSAQKIAALTILGGIALFIVGTFYINDPFGLLFFGFSIPLALAPASIAAAILPQAYRDAIGEWVTVSVLVGTIASAKIFVDSLSSPALGYLPPLYAVIGGTSVLIIGPILSSTIKVIWAKISGGRA